PDGTVDDKIGRHAAEPLPPLTHVPAEVAAVVRRMTAKKPADRFATPGEVAQALVQIKHTPTPTLPAKTAGDRRRSGRRWHVAARSAAAGVIRRIPTNHGEIVLATDDASLEVTVRKGGDIVRIRDTNSGQIWELDAKKYRIASLDHPDGLTVELPKRGTTTLK